MSTNVYGNYGHQTIEDILFREKSFTDMKHNNAASPLPPSATNYSFMYDGHEKKPAPPSWVMGEDYYGNQLKNDHRNIPNTYEGRNNLYSKNNTNMIRPPRTVTPEMVFKSNSGLSNEDLYDRSHNVHGPPRAFTPDMVRESRGSALTPDAISMRTASGSREASASGPNPGNHPRPDYDMFQTSQSYRY